MVEKYFRFRLGKIGRSPKVHIAFLVQMIKENEEQRLSEEQRRFLCHLMHRAFVQLRCSVGHAGPPQATDLADAMHNVPLALLRETIVWGLLRSSLHVYDKKYSTSYEVELDEFLYGYDTQK
jgi:hypothetical protein